VQAKTFNIHRFGHGFISSNVLGTIFVVYSNVVYSNVHRWRWAALSPVLDTETPSQLASLLFPSFRVQKEILSC